MSVKYILQNGTAHEVSQAKALKLARTVMEKGQAKLDAARALDGDEEKDFCELTDKVVLTETPDGKTGGAVADFRNGITYSDQREVKSADDDVYTEKWTITRNSKQATYRIEADIDMSREGSKAAYRRWKNSLPDLTLSRMKRDKTEIRVIQNFEDDGSKGDLWVIDGRDSWVQKASQMVSNAFKAVSKNVKLPTIKLGD